MMLGGEGEEGTSSPPNNNHQDRQQRPRRPLAETLTYLRSLPIPENRQVAEQEIRSFLSQRTTAIVTTAGNNDDNGDDDDETTMVEFPMSLSASLQALYEIRNELASLATASDERAAEILESMFYIVLPHSEYATRVVLDAVSPTYIYHLATHRYGSHVLQTLLELLLVSKNKTTTSVDLALHEEAPPPPPDSNMASSSLPSLTELMDGLVQELEPYVPELVVHMCGSHVLRTVLRVLGNVEYHPSDSFSSSVGRRGKTKTKKKKKKRKSLGDHKEDGQPHATERLVFGDVFDNNQHIHNTELLWRLTRALIHDIDNDNDNTTATPGELQRWACHASAAPVLTTLLQVWTYVDCHSSNTAVAAAIKRQQADWEMAQSTPDRHLRLTRPEPLYTIDSPAHRLVQRLLCWKPQQRPTSPSAANDDDKEAPQEINQQQQSHNSSDDTTAVVGTVIYGLAGETRGSHVLETILRLSPGPVFDDMIKLAGWTNPETLQDYVQDGTSNHVVQTLLTCVKTAEQAQVLTTALEPSITSGWVLDPTNQRTGIIWKLAEMVASDRGGRTCQKRVLEMLALGYTALERRNGSSGTRNLKWKKCIAKVLRIQQAAAVPSTTTYGDGDGDDDHDLHGAGRRILSVDASGARAIYHFLQFDHGLCQDIIKGILELSSDQLELLAKDALCSRCILDGMLERADTPVFAKACRRLVSLLQGHWVAIANDRVGHHVIRRLFWTLRGGDGSTRRDLAETVLAGKKRLHGTSMGRSVLEALEVRVLESQGADEWSRVVKKKVEKAEWLKDIVGADHEGDNVERGVSSKKRKSNADDNTAGTKTSRSTSVDAILDVISIPSKDER